MQYPINSPFDEVGIVFNPNEDESPAAEESGYFSSNRDGGVGGDDIYSFYRAPMLFTLKGKVRDVPISTDALSGKIDMFLDEKSDQLIKDWELATKKDTGELEKKFSKVTRDLGDLERRFNEYRGHANTKFENIEKRLTSLEDKEE